MRSFMSQIVTSIFISHINIFTYIFGMFNELSRGSFHWCLLQEFRPQNSHKTMRAMVEDLMKQFLGTYRIHSDRFTCVYWTNLDSNVNLFWNCMTGTSKQWGRNSMLKQPQFINAVQLKRLEKQNRFCNVN